MQQQQAVVGGDEERDEAPRSDAADADDFLRRVGKRKALQQRTQRVGSANRVVVSGKGGRGQTSVAESPIAYIQRRNSRDHLGRSPSAVNCRDGWSLLELEAY
jgi:hypothetical protein